MATHMYLLAREDDIVQTNADATELMEALSIELNVNAGKLHADNVEVWKGIVVNAEKTADQLKLLVARVKAALTGKPELFLTR